jgi:flagellin
VGGTTASTIVGIDATLFTRDTSDVVSAINVSTKSGANDALAVLDAAIDTVAASRGDLGALQNRLISTVSNLQSVSENLAAANSRITDTDFASETAMLTKAQIIQQAGVAMLSQANSSPQVILALLS